MSIDAVYGIVFSSLPFVFSIMLFDLFQNLTSIYFSPCVVYSLGNDLWFPVKFCHLQADSQVDLVRQHFYEVSLEYVFKVQEVQERKMFEFVEPVSICFCSSLASR